ncbi:hypothetical protein AB0L85_32270 [Streptomyces sp. NPDC052051]|uniref:hypothetical protein n=1 Tax=Streptomyces sp. NPDC052051 TaxID=3154649 RepID=UPI003415D38D
MSEPCPTLAVTPAGIDALCAAGGRSRDDVLDAEALSHTTGLSETVQSVASDLDVVQDRIQRMVNPEGRR